MELREALGQIAEIRRQMSRTGVFRGYRSAPVAFSGALAWGAAIVQASWIPDPTRDIPAYLALWIGAAVIGMAAAGVEMVVRASRAPIWSRELTRQAAEQFLPCIAAGGLLTLVIAARCPEALGMLPGLWSILFSLGVFASCRLLPRATYGVAAYYLAAGLICLALSRPASGPSPWAMGLTFGVGQWLSAVVLYRTLECDHGR